jgi:hypothetical protein
MSVANLDAIASATASRTDAGWRALDVRVWDGIDVRLLPDRGFDCFGAWTRSVLGRAADRAAGRLPVLAPGAERVTRLEVRVEPR